MFLSSFATHGNPLFGQCLVIELSTTDFVPRSNPVVNDQHVLRRGHAQHAASHISSSESWTSLKCPDNPGRQSLKQPLRLHFDRATPNRNSATGAVHKAVFFVDGLYRGGPAALLWRRRRRSHRARLACRLVRRQVFCPSLRSACRTPGDPLRRRSTLLFTPPASPGGA